TYEYSMEKDDGTHIFARSTLVPEIAPDGEVLGCFVLSFDITEQKQTQSALVQAQKMEAVGQLSGGLAHDFNNMLTVVIGNLAELRRHEADNTALLSYLDPALQAAERGVALVRRLLTFARQQPLLPSAVDIGALLQDMLQLIRRSLPESIALQSQLPPAPLFAMADPHQLESAILNLVLNARDAMAEGGSLQLAASLAQLSEREAAEWQLQAGDYVCIEVADTGCGMSPELLLRVFEPFFTTKRFGSGSGLGLAMVYSFARQSGGAIHVSSTPGKGTRFTLRLPHTQHAAQPAGRLNFSGKAGGRERPLTLLVEDNAEVRRVVRLQLTSLGYPVLEAESGDEAALMLENIPDIGLLLSDIVMPGTLDGRALAQLARSLLPRIRVVLMSGYDDSSQRPGSGFAKLEKPFTPAELAALLDEVMLCPPQA
ncbi:MAG: ATP-binding protein, partial [Vogesella sp.]|uniref:ATP-binding protein n=1 Tax=Vogesella sp. TaxID=1904252 RepID=UPI003F331DFA